MYKEIHPFWHNVTAERSAVFSGKMKDEKERDFYQPGEPVLIRLDTIRQIKKQYSTDGTVDLYRLIISEDELQDYLVTPKEMEEIKKELLSTEKQPLAQEIIQLSKAIGNLYDLLRTRLH